ncbi:DUF397 domain-containing protein [Streptomyces sp900116325]|uniref:DUF397 domain-containing protein n=1 Tax=Streptomyces sp. 900116325 TaxID=3154295 RepID=UPI0033170C51
MRDRPVQPCPCSGAQLRSDGLHHGPPKVADLGGGAVAVRDSNNTDLPPLRFTAKEWAAFRDGVRKGEFG